MTIPGWRDWMRPIDQVAQPGVLVYAQFIPPLIVLTIVVFEVRRKLETIPSEGKPKLAFFTIAFALPVFLFVFAAAFTVPVGFALFLALFSWLILRLQYRQLSYCSTCSRAVFCQLFPFQRALHCPYCGQAFGPADGQG